MLAQSVNFYTFCCNKLINKLVTIVTSSSISTGFAARFLVGFCLNAGKGFFLEDLF